MKTHQMRNTKTYASWADMKQRCNNPNNKHYDIYGERGIKYDPNWESFEAFYLDMGEKPEGYTLDRIDNNLGYSKENCRWASAITQATNQRTPRNNTSGHKGVSWDKRKERWISYIYHNKKRIQLGYFKEKEEAISARKEAEIQHHHQFL